MWVLSIGCQRGRFDNLVDRLMVDESIQIAVEGILFLLLLFSSLLIGHWSFLILILDLHIQFVVEKFFKTSLLLEQAFRWTESLRGCGYVAALTDC
jgi:hypothetical protein